MSTNIVARKNTGAVLSRVLEMSDGSGLLEGARFVLGLRIREEDQQRMLDLLAWHQRGEIGAGDREDLESLIEADNMLSVLRAQALLALNRAGQGP